VSKLTLLCWQEIPSVVEAKDSSGSHKVQLSQKFQELIDLIAMKRGSAGTDNYLMEWHKVAQPDREGDAKTVAESLAAEIEGRYEQIKADSLAKS
jgi:hypothetical protein